MTWQPPVGLKVVCTALVVALDVVGLILLWSNVTVGAIILAGSVLATLILGGFGLIYLLDLGRLRRHNGQQP